MNSQLGHSFLLASHWRTERNRRWLHQLLGLGARRRRSGGGPGEGCARRPVGTYLYLHAVGDDNPIAVLGLAR
jgi:hypothetical protein